MTATRLSAEETYAKVNADKALLVCAYDNKEKFNQYHLDGAIPLEEFMTRLTAVPQNKELIFYCA